MRTIEWTEWQTERRARSGAAVRMGQARGPGAGRSRTPEEREMIIRGTVALMRRREREGRLVRVGPREYELTATPTLRPQAVVH